MLERIKKLGKQMGLSLTDVNDKAGLGENTIYKWKHIDPGISKVAAVADVLGVSLDYIAGREAHNLSEESQNVLAKFNCLTASQKADALRYMDFLLSRNPVKKEKEIL